MKLANLAVPAILLFSLIASCGRYDPAISNELPPVWPDYTDVTIPSGIAPMNFGPADSIEETGKRH